MPRRTPNMNSLSRGRIRASMNKYNLFNLYKKVPISYNNQTLFQQKWRSKLETRAYHGEHLTEARWKSIFDKSLESVAQLDASLKGEKLSQTPLALQTFAVLEKRLEFALFRAMFASLIRQARRFILAGDVQVNGIVMKHPSFPLCAGDIFSVKPEKVMFAMGRQKPSLHQAIKVDLKQIAAWNNYVKRAKENPQKAWKLKQEAPASLDTLASSITPSRKESIQTFNNKIEQDMKKRQSNVTRTVVLSKVLALSNGKEKVDASLFAEYGQGNAQKCLSAYNLLADAKHALVTQASDAAIDAFISKKKTDFDTDAEHSLAKHVKQLLSEIVKTHQEDIRVSAKDSMLPENAKTIPFTPGFAEELEVHTPLDREAIVQDETKASINLPWQSSLFGRQDPSKPYFTPWTPRPFIGCFAILPAHIEISFETCHAVYLRNPVARPGYSEVISPLSLTVHERVYMYYGRQGL